ncbi:hypothetical protein NC651_008778 [Populus alba x Populus x berolinensis]|nr:hypothetical protein NC651_008778 [Populus alba x Populus x berolinensis]
MDSKNRVSGHLSILSSSFIASLFQLPEKEFLSEQSLVKRKQELESVRKFRSFFQKTRSHYRSPEIRENIEITRTCL